MTSIAPHLHRIVAAQPYPLLFATISGAQIPQPSFVVLIGVSGSGKSPLARKHFKPTTP
jgi:ABC-type cobalamin/Fe3+-siderophores transport system ATPase subunit